MCSCHLSLISSASVSSIPFLSLIVPIFAWNVPLISVIFLNRSLVFPSLLFSSISLHWSLRKAFLSLLAILWNSAFRWIYLLFLFCLLPLFFSQLFVRPPQATMLPFSFPCGWFWSSPPVQCYNLHPKFFRHSIWSNPLNYVSLPLFNHKRFDLSYLNGLLVSPTFFYVSLNFAIRSSWSEPQSDPGLVLADCTEIFQLQLQRI